MDAEKVTEVEMKTITPEVQDDKDVEKGKMEETKGKKCKIIFNYFKILSSFLIFKTLALAFFFLKLSKEQKSKKIKKKKT